MKIVKSISAVVLLTCSLSIFAQSEFGIEIMSQPDFLQNLPPGETVESPAEPFLRDPAVYLDIDSKGNVYTQKFVQDEFGNYELAVEQVTQSQLEEVSSQNEVVLVNMENISLPLGSLSPIPLASTTSTCPLPTAFSLLGDSNGNALGFQKVSNTYRPAEATTQWITFDFTTINYRGKGSHTPNSSIS